MNILAIGMPGPLELVIIFLVLFVFFGVNKIPKMANSLGKSLTEFKRGKKEGEKLLKDLEKGTEDDD